MYAAYVRRVIQHAGPKWENMNVNKTYGRTNMIRKITWPTVTKTGGE